MQHVHTHTHETHVSILSTSKIMDIIQDVDLIDSALVVYMAALHLHVYMHGLFQRVRYIEHSAAFLTPPRPPFPSSLFLLVCSYEAKSNA